MEYKSEYGWNLGKRKPDFKRCAESVSAHDGWGSSQCARKAVCDPDEHGNPTTCKQHSQDAVKERREKSRLKYEWDEWETGLRRLKWAGGDKLINALRSIESGHNDPRELARETLAEFDNRKPRKATT